MPKSRTKSLFPLLLFALVLTACGGGGGGGDGGGGGGGGGPTAPQDVAYVDSVVVYRTDQPIAPNNPAVTGGTPTWWSIEPSLPGGLAIDAQTGAISGTPEAAAPSAVYTVRCGNDLGEVSTTLTLEIKWIQHKSLDPEPNLDEADYRHFLIRTHWGVADDKLADVQAQGLPAFLDQMLVFPPIMSTQWEQDAQEILRDDSKPADQRYKFPSDTDLKRWWLHLMKENENPFQEVLAFHWHDHFATSSEVLGGGRNYYMRLHVDTLREESNGNVRDLLLRMTRDWAMLWWLDGYISTKSNPNENHARELWELFSLGVKADYTQEEIVEAARALTGYQDLTADDQTGLRYMDFRPNRHDETDKTFFGETIAGQNVTDDYEEVIRVTVDNRPVAEWMCRSLLAGFCYADPEQELIDQLAQVMRDESYEITPVLKVLFRSEAFFSARARKAIVKSPVDFALGFMRTTGLRVRVNEVQNALQGMGNIPTQPPTVNGWPGGPMWLSAQGMLDRANFLNTAKSHSAAIQEQNDHGLDLRDLLPPGTPTSMEVVDAVALRLGIELDDTERARLVEYLDTERQSNGTVIDSPFDPNDPDQVDDRVRGLLYILGQHPSYMVR